MKAKLTHKNNTINKNQIITLETLWLTYYNDVLYNHGVITESERNRMRVNIKLRAENAKGN